MQHITSKELNEIIRYPFVGPDWFVRVVLQGAVLFVLAMFIIGIPFFAGFVAAHARRGIDGSSDYPNWEWGTYWTLGWRLFALNLVYYIPIFVMIIAIVLMMGATVLIGIAAGDGDVAAVFGIFSSFGVMLMYPLFFGYTILYGAVQMATVPLIAAGHPWKAGLQWKQYVWPYLKANFVNLLLVYLITYLASLVGSAGVFFFFIGMFFTMPIVFAIMAYSNGLVYRLSDIKYRG